MRVLITGADGLLGTHLRALLAAKNAAAAYKQKPEPFQIQSAGRTIFDDDVELANALNDVEAIFHFAGVNRGTEYDVANGNQALAGRLIEFLENSNACPHIVYANSIHSRADSAYGRGKRVAAEMLQAWTASASAKFTNLILPHLFGEGGKPFYNSVTATLCHQIANSETVELNPEGKVELLHVGDVADFALKQVLAGEAFNPCELSGKEFGIIELHEKLLSMSKAYEGGLIPDLDEVIDVQLFNTLRSYLFPAYYAKELPLNTDQRGTLYEAVKGGRGQTFLSWTKPGVTRGDHFHLRKVERFLVVSGQARIRVRHIFSDKIHEFDIDGDHPAFVDMPTLHTHSIENIGSEPLLTLFWANEIFDPGNPDTYATKVLKA
jgi:UDP-2-acetamido-2,6-beta-L-arabino-hexul-4-ose reductase